MGGRSSPEMPSLRRPARRSCLGSDFWAEVTTVWDLESCFGVARTESEVATGTGIKAGTGMGAGVGGGEGVLIAPF